MNRSDTAERYADTTGPGRDSSLAKAMLRIGASLDVDTVLREIIDSARALAGASVGVIAAVDETGFPADVYFSGVAPGKQHELAVWPGAPRLFEHFRELRAPLRHANVADYVRALGLEPPPVPATAFQCTPMLHRGVSVGNFFLYEKTAGGEFTEADEEVLMVFASQAAASVANARAHRSERRARADLEALVETSPVGVVVFDVDTGRLQSFNREARRIVETIRTPGRRIEDVLKVLSFRRADGREMSLAELPLKERFASVETVRSEEVVLSVPDGPSVRTLINATPIKAEDGRGGSLVVTMQDLAPLDEIERMRAEFLELVSHELRAPLASIKGSADTLIEDISDLDQAEMREFFRIIAEQARHMRRLVSDLLDAGRIDSGTLSVFPEPSKVTDLVERARSAFLAGGDRHGIVVDLPAGLPPVMADRRRVAQVLDNLLANAARHAPESTRIRIAAESDGAHVAISVADSGSGIAPDLLQHLFRKRVAGGTARHGLGLAICRGLVEAHGGRIRAESDGPGRGTTITFTVPAEAEADVLDKPVADSRESPTAGPPRILVLDDDPRTLRFVRGALADAGFEPLVTGTPDDLGPIVRARRPHLVLLDLVLPTADGIELLRQVPELSGLPVIFISGYGRDETIVRAFEAGAVDYIVKPFSRAELVARVRAALRRRDEPEPFVHDRLAIHYESRRVTVSGRPVALTPTEYELLTLLSRRAGRVVRHNTLLHRVWGRRDDADVNRVRVVVRNLRRKLGDSAESPAWIFSERGVGYRMPAAGGR